MAPNQIMHKYGWTILIFWTIANPILSKQIVQSLPDTVKPTGVMHLLSMVTISTVNIRSLCEKMQPQSLCNVHVPVKHIACVHFGWWFHMDPVRQKDTIMSGLQRIVEPYIMWGVWVPFCLHKAHIIVVSMHNI